LITESGLHAWACELESNKQPQIQLCADVVHVANFFIIIIIISFVSYVI